jgi:hypothetical protein
MAFSCRQSLQKYRVDRSALEDAGLLQRPANEIDLDGVLGIGEDAAELVDEIDEA